jgi:hypothetical protein
MKNREILERWRLNKISVNLGFLNVSFEPSDNDKEVAWAIYVELQTRITTQALEDNVGDEQAALASVYKAFIEVREILIEKGRMAVFCTPVALAMLNSVIRPFTAKWHKKSLTGIFECCQNSTECKLFRDELKLLQDVLIKFAALFSAISYGEAYVADVEKFMETFTTYVEI